MCTLKKKAQGFVYGTCVECNYYNTQLFGLNFTSIICGLDTTIFPGGLLFYVFHVNLCLLYSIKRHTYAGIEFNFFCPKKRGGNNNNVENYLGTNFTYCMVSCIFLLSYFVCVHHSCICTEQLISVMSFRPHLVSVQVLNVLKLVGVSLTWLIIFGFIDAFKATNIFS